MTEIALTLPDQAVDALAEALAARLAAQKPADAADVVEAWRLLNLEEAAARLGRSTRWVRERVRRGDLPFVRLDGGALAFELEDLQAFARVRRVSAEESRPALARLHALDRGAAWSRPLAWCNWASDGAGD